MAINFPASPTNGQSFTANGTTTVTVTDVAHGGVGDGAEDLVLERIGALQPQPLRRQPAVGLGQRPGALGHPLFELGVGLVELAIQDDVVERDRQPAAEDLDQRAIGFGELPLRLQHHHHLAAAAGLQVEHGALLVELGGPDVIDKTLGLIDAAHRFDEERGIKFETFAERRVRGAMIDALRKDAWPRGVRRQRRELDAAREALRRELGHEPSMADLAARVGSDEKRLSRTIVRINTIESTSPLASGDRQHESSLPAVLVPAPLAASASEIVASE